MTKPFEPGGFSIHPHEWVDDVRRYACTCVGQLDLPGPSRRCYLVGNNGVSGRLSLRRQAVIGRLVEGLDCRGCEPGLLVQPRHSFLS